ncbi:MAG: hypothetical protein HYW22_01350 [Candidatus Aenigmarchaeota archaeon]|nr:hypothetical protein [Candidatus Aenigmarchaeota archaeon]
MNEHEQLQKLEEMKKTVIKKLLTKEAIERLGRIRVVKPEIANQLELYLVQLYEGGKINKMISDEQLKDILGQISQKQKFRILR